MKPSNNTIYFVGALSLVGIGLVSMFKNKNDNSQDVPQEPTIEPTNTNQTTNTSTNNNVSIDIDKILKLGVVGNEVKILQKKLGINSDGVFGKITEAKLYDVKGVKQISLSKWDSIQKYLFNVGEIVKLKQDLAIPMAQETNLGYYTLQPPVLFNYSKNDDFIIKKQTTTASGVEYFVKLNSFFNGNFFKISEKYLTK